MDCPVCGTQAASEADFPGTGKQYGCPRCGRWLLIPDLGDGPRRQLDDVLDGWGPDAVHRRSRLSHILRRQQHETDQIAGVQVHRLLDFRLDDPLPNPAEQLDRLLLWMADHQPSYSEKVALLIPDMAAWIGVQIDKRKQDAGVIWLLNEAVQQRLIENWPPSGVTRLTMAGWKRVDEIRRDVTSSRTAFMALQFRDPEVEQFVRDVFRPAVRRAGYELRTLEDGQGAGLIDDQLRVALRTARFVIADLTRGNKGAYWEAGFAEGLGRPVIYTCRKSEWDDPREKPHFDINHMLHIVWDPGEPDSAGQKLTSVIRATLPEEAVMTD